MEEQVEFTGRKSKRYVTTQEVADVVNLAIALGRPILVEGEPGCGKTRLAYAIAEELGLGDPVTATVTSTSTAKDLLYRFDALRRLQDVQDPERPEEARFIHPYVALEPLGEAIRAGERKVVLIDEIDKADIDFPNDLLEVLDSFRFKIDEVPLGERVLFEEKKGYGHEVSGPGGTSDRPIVVITSNQEKRLPEPFLRRCLYLYLRFPTDPTLLKDIVEMNFNSTLGKMRGGLITKAVERFLEMRGKSIELGPQKAPATSELIDWVHALHWSSEKKQALQDSGLRPPHWQMLFKTIQDLSSYKAQTEPDSE